MANQTDRLFHVSRLYSRADIPARPDSVPNEPGVCAATGASLR
jgi:hypothetical protein